MSQSTERIYLSSPHMSGLEQKYIAEAFQTNWIAPLGPHVDQFEQEFAAYLRVQGAAALSSGTAAIHLALQLLQVGAGDTVFCSTLTFVASANPILYQGAEPVFIDSEPDSWNMSPVALEKAFEVCKKQNKLPKAVIIVHLYGQSANMSPLLEICAHYGVPVIEDAAESLGATYAGQASGTWGKFGIYSFNGNKIITTSGGGMLVSNDVEALQQARFLATQARDPAPHYQHSRLGYNYRMSNLLAGVGRAQLRVLEERVQARRSVFQRYWQAFGAIQGIQFMPEAAYGQSTRWLTALTVNPQLCGVTRDELLKALEKEQIEARPVWKPLHLQPLFQRYDFFLHEGESNAYLQQESVAEALFEQGLCLPSGSNLTLEQQERVITCIRSCLEG